MKKLQARTGQPGGTYEHDRPVPNAGNRESVTLFHLE
jgi:hypothetical protein